MEKRPEIARLGVLALRIGIGGLFVYAGAVKALDPVLFLKDIESYRLLPYVPAVLTALYLPYLELVAGVCVIFKKLDRGALGVLMGLVVVFILALVSAWARGLDVSCGCFGTRGAGANYPWLLTRDLFILAAIGWLIRNEPAAISTR